MATFIPLLLGALCHGQETTAQTELLWYKQPAEKWEQALPLGNGKLGAMVFGRVSQERIQLNDDSLLPADDQAWTNPAGTKNDLKALRTLLLAGNHTAADKLFVEKFSRKTIIRSHQTLGDLTIDFGHRNVTDYRRVLDISNAVSKTSYKAEGHAFSQEVFVSNPDKVIVVQLKSDAPEGFNAKIKLGRPKDGGFETAKVFSDAPRSLTMAGEVTQRTGKFDSKPFPILHGVKFETCLNVRNDGGTVHTGSDSLELKNVKTATLFIASNSSFYFEDFREQNRVDLQAIGTKSFQDLKTEHIADYRRFYSRLDIQLGEPGADSIPTDQRILNIQQGQIDTDLETLLFQYGRYLLISSSREGTNPANLQGLWNKHIEAPWNADYHLNINLQMNYWVANMTNLGELNSPLFDFIDRLIENGKGTASQNFGCRGAFIPHATDLWAPTWLRAPTAYWGCSVGAGGWLMQHYWMHYEYTRDKDFLKQRAFPAMHEVARFYSDWLIEDPRDGTLVSAPSTSPENRFYDSNENPVASCLGSAMDQQVIRELFTNYLAACEILDIESDFRDEVATKLARLRPGFVLGSDGRILEWDRPYKEFEPGHRHMSHLYGFHPGNQVTKIGTPDLFNAVRRTLEYRLKKGGAGTGWSRAWLINCSARLLEGDMAHEHIQLLLKKSMSKNLFDLCPPFQIDGNFGYTAGVTEMLLQSHEQGTLRVLPALPKQWGSGYIKGLKARGGLTVDIAWSNHRLESVHIKAAADTEFDVVYQDLVLPVTLKRGQSYTYKPSLAGVE